MEDLSSLQLFKVKFGARYADTFPDPKSLYIRRGSFPRLMFTNKND
jgi:hypothetical protein